PRATARRPATRRPCTYSRQATAHGGRSWPTGRAGRGRCRGALLAGRKRAEPRRTEAETVACFAGPVHRLETAGRARGEGARTRAADVGGRGLTPERPSVPGEAGRSGGGAARRERSGAAHPRR